MPQKLDELGVLLLVDTMKELTSQVKTLEARIDALEDWRTEHTTIKNFLFAIVNKWYFWMTIIGIMMCLDFKHVIEFYSSVASHLNLNMEGG